MDRSDKMMDSPSVAVSKRDKFAMETEHHVTPTSSRAMNTITRTVKRRSRGRGSAKKKKLQLFAYHQRLVEERGYPLSRLQLKQLKYQSEGTPLQTNQGKVTYSRVKRLEEDFCLVAEEAT